MALVSCDNDPNRLPCSGRPKPPFPTLDSSNCFIEGQIPSGAVLIYSSYAMNTLMGITAIRLLDARDLYIFGHQQTS